MKTYAMREVNNELYLGNIRLSELVKDHPTPLYVYDEAGIEHKISQFRTHFTSKQFFVKRFMLPKLFSTLFMPNA